MAFQGVIGSGSAGDIKVIKTDGGTHPPEVWAALALRRILHVADTAPEPIRLQAYAFKEQIQGVLAHVIRDAVDSAVSFRAMRR